MENIENMPYDIYKKCFNLKCQSKTRIMLRDEDFDFLNECHKKFPVTYKSMEKEVFNQTKPFGSK